MFKCLALKKYHLQVKFIFKHLIAKNFAIFGKLIMYLHVCNVHLGKSALNQQSVTKMVSFAAFWQNNSEFM